MRLCGDLISGIRGPEAPVRHFLRATIGQRKTKGGVENSGEGKTYHKTPPQKRFWTPPPMIRSPPPPVCSRNVISLRGNGHRPDQSHFRSPPKLFLEGTPKVVRFPPPKSHDTFPPRPVGRFPNWAKRGGPERPFPIGRILKG